MIDWNCSCRRSDLYDDKNHDRQDERDNVRESGALVLGFDIPAQQKAGDEYCHLEYVTHVSVSVLTIFSPKRFAVFSAARFALAFLT